MKTCSIIDAPSDLGLRRTGVDGLPDALRAAGLLEGLQDVRYAGRVPVPPYDPLRDQSTGVLNPGGIAAGMEVTVYNPTFDNAERSAARTLARAVTAAFATTT